jgi:hypothetical protein
MAFASPRTQAQSRRELGRLLGGAPEGPVLAFVGTMTAKHNAFAASWIVDVLAPSLPPAATVVLCGAGSERLHGRGAGARVVALGRVDDVDSVVAAADLCLAPLASGAGVKTKMLHYLTHGRRVAGTPVAAEGLDGAPGVYSASLDQLPALVQRLIARHEPRRVAEQRAAEQRAWVERFHGRDLIAAQWRGVLQCVSPV